MKKKLNVVILAAGQGKRMNSAMPKVLHKIGGTPMLCHVINAALALQPNKIIIVYGHGGEYVKQVVHEYNKDIATNTVSVNNKCHAELVSASTQAINVTPQIVLVKQDKQLGTGHALQCALLELDADTATLLLYGDVPLISVMTLNKMLAKYSDNIVMLTAHLSNPFGYGRVLHDGAAKITGIVEEKDATEIERQITEVNSGIYLFPGAQLPAWLGALSNNNSQGEYYVTDVVSMAHNAGVVIDAVVVENTHEIMGVNNKVQLEYLERVLQQAKAEQVLLQGATLLDKSRIDIRGELVVGMDVVIDVNCIFEGTVTLGNNVTIGAGCILKNVVVADNVVIKPYSVLEDAVVGDDCQIGPFSRLRPGAQLSANVHVGNFVEIKKSVVGVGSKVNHLTYIGDAEIGSGVNIGAGSVTCNYDGKNKFKTIIEDNVFVGSGTMLVAPVKLGHGSIIGAGSTITKDTPADELTLERSRQVTVPGWKKRHR